MKDGGGGGAVADQAETPSPFSTNHDSAAALVSV